MRSSTSQAAILATGEHFLTGPNPAKAVLSIAEFCSAYGLGTTRAYEEIGAGRLKALKSGARTLIRVADAEAWLNALPSVTPKNAA